MATLYPDIVAEYHKNPGGWLEFNVADGKLVIWQGGPFAKMNLSTCAWLTQAQTFVSFPWALEWSGPFMEGKERQPFMYARRIDDPEQPGTNAWLEWSYAEEVPRVR